MWDSEDESNKIRIIVDQNDIKNILDITSLTHAQVVDLNGQTTRNTRIILSIIQQLIIENFNGYTTNISRKGTPPKMIEWFSVTQEIFGNFRASISRTEFDLVQLKTPDKTVTISKPYTFDLLQNSNQGITHEPTLFFILKDLKKWNTWYISTKYQDREQHVDNIYDSKYMNMSVDEKLVFKEDK